MNTDFYEDLMVVLDEHNAAHKEQVSFRKAVVEGLGLRDSFTSKIKTGAYRPTAARIESLANLLGISPARFRSYGFRLAESASVEDPRFVQLFEILAGLPKPAYEVMVSGILTYTRNTLTQASKSH